MNNRTCPKCKQAHVIPDGYCGVCRECTLEPLPVERGTDSQQRVVRTRQLCVLCVEDVPVGWTEDAIWAVEWQNQLHCRYVKVLPEIVRSES